MSQEKAPQNEERKDIQKLVKLLKKQNETASVILFFLERHDPKTDLIQGLIKEFVENVEAYNQDNIM